MTSYQIGQYRYTGSGCFTQDNSISIIYKNTLIGETFGDTSSSSSFRDIIVIPTNGLVKNADYYISFSIPQDLNYDYNFNIKLINQSSNDENDYQYVKTINVYRGGSSNNIYNVCLYEDLDENISVMIPYNYVSATTASVRNRLYYDKNTGYYYLGTGLTSSRYKRTTKINSVSLSANWKTEKNDLKATFEMVFKPFVDGFDAILLEMVRGAEDYNIQQVINGETLYGRYVDIEDIKNSIVFGRLTNLVNNINTGKALRKIGVWGHPGTLMSINGEEIIIGNSSYYELNDFEISSLGIYAPNNNFKYAFSVDYEYPIEE